MMVFGLGHDVVDVAAFAAQLAEPGSRMRALFSARELRQAAARAQAKHDEEAVHLAAKWAGKESVLKAWCEVLGERPYPFTLDDFPWREVEILDDSRGVPHVILSGAAASAFRESVAGVAVRPIDPVPGPYAVHADSIPVIQPDVTADGPSAQWHISLSHDGPIASAVAVLD